MSGARAPWCQALRPRAFVRSFAQRQQRHRQRLLHAFKNDGEQLRRGKPLGTIVPASGEGVEASHISRKHPTSSSSRTRIITFVSIDAMGTEVLRPHDCLARSRRQLRPARRMTAVAARQGHGHGGGGARGSTPSVTETTLRQVRTKVVAPSVDAYAGPAFGAMSPSPRALPLPRFSSRMAIDVAVPGVDAAATRELRQLLGLH